MLSADHQAKIDAWGATITAAETEIATASSQPTQSKRSSSSSPQDSRKRLKSVSPAKVAETRQLKKRDSELLEEAVMGGATRQLKKHDSELLEEAVMQGNFYLSGNCGSISASSPMPASSSEVQAFDSWAI